MSSDYSESTSSRQNADITKAVYRAGSVTHQIRNGCVETCLALRTPSTQCIE